MEPIIKAAASRRKGGREMPWEPNTYVGKVEVIRHGYEDGGERPECPFCLVC